MPLEKKEAVLLDNNEIWQIVIDPAEYGFSYLKPEPFGDAVRCAEVVKAALSQEDKGMGESHSVWMGCEDISWRDSRFNRSWDKSIGGFASRKGSRKAKRVMLNSINESRSTNEYHYCKRPDKILRRLKGSGQY